MAEAGAAAMDQSQDQSAMLKKLNPKTEQTLIQNIIDYIHTLPCNKFSHIVSHILY